LGNRLLPVFNSPTGLPYVYVNLKTGQVRDTKTNPAETGTLLLEFGTLSKLTGKSIYYENLWKCWLLFGDKDCQEMWQASISAVNKYLADEVRDELWYGHANMNTG